MLKANKIGRGSILMTLLVLGLFLAGAGQTSAQSATVAGEWDAAMNTPGGVRNFKIVFQVDGEKVTGTVKRSSGDVPLTGTIKGNDLRFSYTISYGENNLTLSMTGKVDGDTINGTVAFGESGQEDAWSAKRTPAPK